MTTALSEIGEIGHRLRQARRQAGLSARDLGRLAAERLSREKPISESAVRNQENGTNGIPMDLLLAYAEILGVEAPWLVFGDHLKVPADPGKVIQIASPLSARGSEYDNTVSPSTEYRRMSIPHGKASVYFGSYVTDDSLAPHYVKGSLIVWAGLKKEQVHDGDHVVVFRPGAKKETILQSVMLLRQTPAGPMLLGLGEAAHDPALSLGDYSAVAGVVRAVFRYIGPKSTEPIRVDPSDRKSVD